MFLTNWTLKTAYINYFPFERRSQLIVLRDYQLAAHGSLVEALEAEKKALGVMATGLGKTYVAAFISKDEIKGGKKGLLLCHETGILQQNMSVFREILGDMVSLKTFFGGKNKDWDADKADILFATFDILGQYNWRRAFFRGEFNFIIVDESHHSQAPTYKAVLDYFDPEKLLGITATPDREDGKEIREIFGEEVVNISLEEAVVNGWLSSVEYHVKNGNLNHWALKRLFHGVVEEGKRVSMKQLNETLFIDSRDEEIARIIQEHCLPNKKALIFCEGIPHADHFAQFLPNARTYHSGNNPRNNNEINRENLSMFRRGEIQFLLTVNKCNEGIDIPDAEVIIFLRCTDSKTIFFQQLGRGLRKTATKKKVVVLDFVANYQRLVYLNEMSKKMKALSNGKGLELAGEVLRITGNNFDFIFTDEQVDILEVIKRISASFYSTWQKAGAAAIKLGIKTEREYCKNFHRNYKLPSNPNIYYPDFPGYGIFLGTERELRKKSACYSTWVEAGNAARKLGIKKMKEYMRKYKLDPRLPSDPSKIYAPDYPGWSLFIGKFFRTWEKASAVAIGMGIKTQTEYTARRKENPRLPSDPRGTYENFPGFSIFLGKEERTLRRAGDCYSECSEASAAAIRLGIKSHADYTLRYKTDPMLPSSPNRTYSDFPGWLPFLGRKGGRRRTKKRAYPDWKSASNAAIGIGAKTERHYEEIYKCDPRLPSDPLAMYDDFPGWNVFLGNPPKKTFYSTWQEAGRAAVKLGIRSSKQYKDAYKKDPKLPSSPYYVYKDDWPGHRAFFGNPPKKSFYSTWQEASWAAIKMGVKGAKHYSAVYKKDPRLPSGPNDTYKNDWPGWKIFLGKEKKKI